MLSELSTLSAEQLNRSVPVPEANTLFALATHLVGAGEFWVLALAGGQKVDRDRPSEFRASGDFADLEARYARWIGDVRAVLAGITSEQLDARAAPPDEYRGSVGDTPMSVRACVLHAIEHSALHLGHIQLTRSLLADAEAPG